MYEGEVARGEYGDPRVASLQDMDLTTFAENYSFRCLVLVMCVAWVSVLERVFVEID